MLGICTPWGLCSLCVRTFGLTSGMPHAMESRWCTTLEGEAGGMKEGRRYKGGRNERNWAEEEVGNGIFICG